MTEYDTGRRTVKGTNEARAAVTGHKVRYVLIVSLVAVIVVFAGLWMFLAT